MSVRSVAPGHQATPTCDDEAESELSLAAELFITQGRAAK